jgi:hypothetical protein
MKKLLLTACIALIGFSAVNAQDGQAGQGQGQGQRQGGGQFREQMKKALKDEMKFTDVQVDSVMSIQQFFQGKMRQIRMDANASEEQKATQLKALGEERKAKLKAVLSEEQITKLDAYYENMRKNRPQGGGNRPGGGNGNGGGNGSGGQN